MRELAKSLIRLIQGGGFLLDKISVTERSARFTLKHNGGYVIEIKPESIPDDPRLQIPEERTSLELFNEAQARGDTVGHQWARSQQADPGPDYKPHEWVNDEPDKGLL